MSKRVKYYFRVFIISSLLMTFLSLAFGGDKVGNGGGVAEQNFYFAFINLETVLKHCLLSNQCLSSPRQRQLVKKILETLPLEYKGHLPLKFISDDKNKKIFEIDGSIRTAVTGHRIGDTIYVNTDLIYFYEGRRKAPMSISSAMGLLVHELGHHHEVMDHDWLDWVGVQIKAFSISKMDILKTDNYMDVGDSTPPQFVVTAIHRKLNSGDPLNGAETSLLFSDERSVHNLELQLSKVLNVCPATETKSTSNLLGYRLYDIGWDSSYIGKNKISERTYILKTSVEMYCQDIDDPNYPVRFDNSKKITVRIPVEFKLATGEGHCCWVLDEKSVKVTLGGDL